MSTTSQKTNAAKLRALHTSGTLVVPNAWDAGSARLIERSGALAIATTSAGVSWALGRQDGQHISPADQAEVTRRIVDAVQIPVSVDIEGGYGPGEDSISSTVRGVIGAGAVGVNLEDSQEYGLPLYTEAEQAARIKSVRDAASDAELRELVINARTDVYLFGIGEPESRFDDVIARSVAYAEAGADILFVPGLSDLATIRELVKKSALPINIMAGPGAPSVPQLAEAGVRRVSVGSAIAEAAYELAEAAAKEILTSGTYVALGNGAFSSINGAFATK